MKSLFRYIWALALLLFAWKAASETVSSAVLIPPEKAFVAFSRALKSGLFRAHFFASAIRVVSAMALAWAVAFPIGIATGFWKKADSLISPLIFLTYPVPKIVLLPLFLLFFGIGDLSKIMMIALITGFQILVATRDAVINLDRKYFDSLKSIGGKAADEIRHVAVPAALPGGFTALRIGTGTSIAILFFVESFATQKGLGYLIMDSWGRFDYEQMFVGIIGMSLLGVALYEILNYLERRVCFWKQIEIGQPVPPDRTILKERMLLFGRMIKFSHTIFAFPFALAAVVLTGRYHEIGLVRFLWIILAVIGARSAAMGFNRIVDADFDRVNPRTADRAVAAGKLSKRSAYIFVLISSLVFILSAALISRLCFMLSVPTLLILLAYSYTKRFTIYSHIYLGFAISLAPAGAWIAVTGGFDPRILSLSVALLTYIAGFDILYACQDIDFDKKSGLFSIPAAWGPGPALHFSSILHLISFFSLTAVLILFDLGAIYLLFLIITGVLFIIEHRLVKPDDLTRINAAFFHVNSIISTVIFLGILIDEIF